MQAAPEGLDDLPTIFISYCHADRSLAEAIASALEPLRRDGVASVWIDKTSMRSGNHWPDEIRDALDGAHLVLFVLTNRAALARDHNSFMWRYEYARAIERWRGRELVGLVPVIAEDVAGRFNEFADTAILLNFNSAPYPTATMADLPGDAWFAAVRGSVSTYFDQSIPVSLPSEIDDRRRACVQCCEDAISEFAASKFPMGGYSAHQVAAVLESTAAVLAASGTIMPSSLFHRSRAISRLRFALRDYAEQSIVQRLYLLVDDLIQVIHQTRPENIFVPASVPMAAVDRGLLGSAVGDVEKGLDELAITLDAQKTLILKDGSESATLSEVVSDVSTRAEIVRAVITEPMIDANALEGELSAALSASAKAGRRTTIAGGSPTKAFVRALHEIQSALTSLVELGKALVRTAREVIEGRSDEATESTTSVSPSRSLDQGPTAVSAELKSGEILRTTREGRGMTLADAASATRIRAGYLEAFETMTSDRLPGDPYAHKFLEAYCKLIELNSGDLIALAEREGWLPTLEQRKLDDQAVATFKFGNEIQGYSSWGHLAPVPWKRGSGPKRRR